MKILCEFSPGGSATVRAGWGRVLASMGHAFVFWDPRTKCAHDAFAEHRPDWFLGTTYGLTRAVEKCVRARPDMRVSLFCSAAGPLVDGLDRREFPIDRASEEELAAVARLYADTGRPDFVFMHVPDRFVGPVLGHWSRTGTTPIGVMNGGDVLHYHPGRSVAAFRCDASICSGYWPYKARNHDRFVLPLCHPASWLDVKIWGHSAWPVAQYLGQLEEGHACDAFASAAVSMNVSEPHSTQPSLGYDVVERCFKAPLCGGFLVSDHVPALVEDVFAQGEVPTGRTPKEFHELVRHYASRPEERLGLAEKARRTVLRAHTYHHRVAKFFMQLGLPQEASRCMALWQKLVGAECS